MSGNQIIMVVLAILFTLLLRDLPYFNVVIIGKMWIVYLFLFLVILLSRIRVKLSTISYVTILLLGVAMVLTLLSLKFFAEAIGIILYLSMWIVLGVKMWSYLREST